MNDKQPINWRKSSRSDQHGGDCVEVADLSPVVAVRDSKHPDGPMLGFDRAAFRSLTRDIRSGRFAL